MPDMSTPAGENQAIQSVEELGGGVGVTDAQWRVRSGYGSSGKSGI